MRDSCDVPQPFAQAPIGEVAQGFRRQTPDRVVFDWECAHAMQHSLNVRVSAAAAQDRTARKPQGNRTSDHQAEFPRPRLLTFISHQSSVTSLQSGLTTDRLMIDRPHASPVS